jgi:hypothetical protein
LLTHLGSAGIGLVWGWLIAGPAYRPGAAGARAAVATAAVALASAAVLGQVWLMGSAGDAAVSGGFAVMSAATRGLARRRGARRYDKKTAL